MITQTGDRCQDGGTVPAGVRTAPVGVPEGTDQRPFGSAAHIATGPALQREPAQRFTGVGHDSRPRHR
jgi:hypothetical protein